MSFYLPCLESIGTIQDTFNDCSERTESFFKEEFRNTYFQNRIQAFYPSKLADFDENYFLKPNLKFYCITGNFMKIIPLFQRFIISIYSRTSNLDTCNSLCAFNSKLLYLFVDKETYQTIGIQGIKQKIKKNENKYLIEINIGKQINEKSLINKIQPFFSRFEYILVSDDISETDLTDFEKLVENKKMYIESISTPNFEEVSYKYYKNKELENDIILNHERILDYIGLVNNELFHILNTSEDLLISTFNNPFSKEQLLLKDCSLFTSTGSFLSDKNYEIVEKSLRILTSNNIPFCILSFFGTKQIAVQRNGRKKRIFNSSLVCDSDLFVLLLKTGESIVYRICSNG